MRVDQLYLCFYCARLYISIREAAVAAYRGGLDDGVVEGDYLVEGEDFEEVPGSFKWPGIKN